MSECLLCESKQVRLYFEREDKNLGQRSYWLCSVCELVYLDPACRLNAEDEKKRYDLHQNSPDDKDYVDFLKRLTDPLMKFIPRGGQGLDFGCGPGPTVQSIYKEEGVSVNNYDPYYFSDKDLLDKQYDFIVSTEVIEHFYRPRDEFILLKSLLKSRGVLGVMTSIRSSECDFASWWYHTEPTHVCFYHAKTFQWIGKWLGWEVVFPSKNVIVFHKVPAISEKKVEGLKD